MAWFRRSRPDPEPEDLSTGTVTIRPREPASDRDASEVGAGEPPPPDPAVLDELSEAFAVVDEDHVDDGTADRADDPAAVISIGADDDLPEAVYLDEVVGEGGDGSGSSPLFIDDDDRSDPLPTQDATGAVVEPRLRQRRIGVNRAASRRRLWWAGAALVVIALVVGALAVLGSSWFAVEQVSVSGNVYTDPDGLAEVVDDLEGTPVLLVDTRAAEARLEEIPWVESARVTTRFPDSATVEIRERTPVASIAGSDGLFRVLDADGRVLDVIEGQPVALVWIAGPETLDLAPGTFAPVGYSSAASLVTKLTPNIRGRVEAILVTPDGSDLAMVLTSPNGPIEVRFGSAIGDNAQIEKLVRLERTLEDRSDEVLSVIDVSTAQVTVR